MDFIQSAILGLVQGLTEFIPVSSTGHLILARKIMGLDLAGSLSFDAILQLATGLAVLLYFWRDVGNLLATGYKLLAVSFRKKEKIEIKENEKKLILAIIVGSIPAVILGLILSDYMDTVFRGTTVVAVSLILGAVLFYVAEKFARETAGKSSSLNGVPNRSEELPAVSFGRALIVGLFQCLALVPGMSRSGSTIAGGLFVGLNRELATRFSFLLSLPIIFGSGLKKVWDLYQGGLLSQVESSLIIASIFAFVSGLLAIHFLLKFLKNHSLNYFGIYRLILAIIILSVFVL